MFNCYLFVLLISAAFFLRLRYSMYKSHAKSLKKENFGIVSVFLTFWLLDSLGALKKQETSTRFRVSRFHAH